MIIGHKKQIKFLESILATEKIPQSYLFTGPENIGKLTIAKLFANILANKTKQKIKLQLAKEKFENTNPDIEILAPKIVEKKGIKKIENIEVKQVREAQKNLALFPVGRYRVLIIDDAEKLNSASQNTLLKTLEEPTSTAVIILISSQDGKMLETIKSRCQKINFNLVPFEEIKDGFRDKFSDNLLEKATLFSMGRPGKVVQLSEDKKILTDLELIADDLRKLSKMNTVEKFNLAEKYAKNLPETIKKLEFWVWFLRIQAYRSLNSEDKTKQYYQLIEKMIVALEKLKKANFNNRLILENLFLSL